MAMGFQIRAATAEDIESIFAVDRAIATAPHWGVADYVAALTPRDVEATESGTGRCLFVAARDDGIAGFAVGRATAFAEEMTVELESVAVAESSRRCGVGKALCAVVIEWARGRGACAIELEVRSRSAGAIALYAGLGFEAMGMRKGYYRSPEDDAILMRLLV